MTNKVGKVTAKVHNLQVYNIAPKLIKCISYNNRTCKLALARGDSSIEIWDVCHTPYFEKRIIEWPSTVEALCWAGGDRLFAAGKSGFLIECDLAALKTKHTQVVTGGAILCLDVDKRDEFLAVGTQDGYLNFFDIKDGSVMYEKLFDKQDGKILCCKFDETGEFIVTGSLDIIRIWSTKTGHAIRKMTLSRSEKKQATIVWSLQVLKDFTILSGDSRGQITVWDGKMGAQIEAHQAMQADILSIAVNEEENMLICSGIEPIIRIYSLTVIPKPDQVMKKWIKFLQRKVHHNDIMAVACVGKRVFSGGLDGFLGVCSYSKIDQNIARHGPLLKGPCAFLSTQHRLVMLIHSNYLDLWYLGHNQKNNKEQDIQNGSFQSFPKIILKLKSRKSENIVCSALSPDGRFLVYSTNSSIRLFALNYSDDYSVQITRITEVPEQFSVCTRLTFSFDSKTLFMTKVTNELEVFSILPTEDVVDHVETIDVNRHIKDVVDIMIVSECGNYLVLVGTCRTISIFTKHNKKNNWKHNLNLPKYLTPTSAIAIHKDSSKLVVAYTDNKILEYDLKEMRFTALVDKKSLNSFGTHCVKGIVLDPRNKNFMILYNEFNYVMFEKTKSNIYKNRGSKVANIEDDRRMAMFTSKFQKPCEHLAVLTWLSSEELLAIGINSKFIIDQLAPPIRQKKFGIS